MPLPISMDATWLDGAVQFNGQELRRADGSLFTGDGNSPFGVQGGIVRHNDSSLAVTVSVADVVTVQPGAVVIPGNVASNGVYRAALAAADGGNLVARNATNPRIDLVVFRALDTSVVAGHGAYTGRIEVIAGTPAASPVVPTLPTLAVELARITVPAAGGAAATVDSTWRTFAAGIGGTLPVTTFARLPATPNAKWLEAVTIDTGKRYVWNGTLWLGPTYTNATLTNGWTGAVQYARDGRTVTINLGVTKASWVSNDFICAAGAIPPDFVPPTSFIGFGTNSAIDNAQRSWFVQNDGAVRAAAAGTGSITGLMTFVI